MTYLNSADQIGEGGCNTGFLSDFPTIALTGTGLADVTLTLRGRLADSGVANPRRLGESDIAMEQQFFPSASARQAKEIMRTTIRFDDRADRTGRGLSPPCGSCERN